MDVIDTICEVVAERMETTPRRPKVPLEYELWDLAEMGAYFGRSPDMTRLLTSMPDFPKPVRFPNLGKAKSHPRWVALEVINWTLKQRDE